VDLPGWIHAGQPVGAVPQTVDGSFDDCCFDVFMTQRNSRLEAVVQCFVEIHNHDHARFNGDAEQSDVADPHRCAEVVSEQLLQNQPTRKRIDRRENEDGGFRDGVKHGVEQEKDDKEDDG
jgi:hypothetical protein